MFANLLFVEIAATYKLIIISIVNNSNDLVKLLTAQSFHIWQWTAEKKRLQRSVTKWKSMVLVESLLNSTNSLNFTAGWHNIHPAASMVIRNVGPILRPFSKWHLESSNSILTVRQRLKTHIHVWQCLPLTGFPTAPPSQCLEIRISLGNELIQGVVTNKYGLIDWLIDDAL